MWFDKKKADAEKKEVVIDVSGEWNEYLRVHGYSHIMSVALNDDGVYDILNSMGNITNTFNSAILHNYIPGVCSRPLKVHKKKNRMGCRTKSLSLQ